MVCFVNQAFTKLNILKRFKNVVQKFGLVVQISTFAPRLKHALIIE